MSPRSNRNSGVSVLRASATGANAETISEIGAVTALSTPLSFHVVRIDIESLPTGIDRPIATQVSIATARTVSYSAASSPGCPAGAIQFAESFTSPRARMPAAARLVIASPTAMRPEAGASISASGVRSPMAIASPAYPSKSISVTATSATGTCQGPTIGSREHSPPTVRSPMVTRNVLSATAGNCSTRNTASLTVIPVKSSGGNRRATCATLRVIFGALPRITSRGISTGLLPKCGSATTSRPSALPWPTTAMGQRSRAHRASNSGNDSGRIASTYRSCASLHQISRGDIPGASVGNARRSKVPPTPPPCTSSGSAFDRPPAPTSCSERIGLRSPICQQRSITSCARRSISALLRWTESKSRSAVFAPVAMDEAAPPPMPISNPGPPI